jgi:hypothetical protein
VQSSITILPADKLAVIYFARTDSGTAKTLTFTHNGTTRYSHFHTPLVTRHNDLPGIQGGSSTERYHLTAAEYAAVSSGTGISEASQTVATNDWVDIGAGSFQQYVIVSTGGALIMNTAPFNTTSPGKVIDIILIGGSSTNTMMMVETDSAEGALLNGDWTSARGKSIHLRYSPVLARWVEISRSF